MVRSKGLEPSRLLGTTTSRLRVYQFHHERIAGRGIWLKHRPLDKPFLPSRWPWLFSVGWPSAWLRRVRQPVAHPAFKPFALEFDTVELLPGVRRGRGDFKATGFGLD